jgi:hypothetical protein
VAGARLPPGVLRTAPTSHAYRSAHAAGGGPAAPPTGEALRPLLEPLATLLYDALRPRFVQLSDIDSLVDLIDILQGEVGGRRRAGRRWSGRRWSGRRWGGRQAGRWWAAQLWTGLLGEVGESNSKGGRA